MTKISDIATGKNLKKLRSGRNHKDEPFVTYDFFVDERTSDKYCPTRYIQNCTQKRATSGYQNGKKTHWIFLQNYDHMVKKSPAYFGRVRSSPKRLGGQNLPSNVGINEERLSVKLHNPPTIEMVNESAVDTTMSLSEGYKLARELILGDHLVITPGYNATVADVGKKCIVYVTEPQGTTEDESYTAHGIHRFFIIEITREGPLNRFSQDQSSDFSYSADDWGIELYGSPDIFDPFLQSGKYKLLAQGYKRTVGLLPKLKLEIIASNTCNQSWFNAFCAWSDITATGKANYKQSKKASLTFEMKEGDEIFFSIDGEQKVSDYSRWASKAKRSQKNLQFIKNANICSYLQTKGQMRSISGECDTSITMYWSVSGWYEDDDQLKCGSALLDSAEIGEPAAAVQQLRWFAYQSREEILGMTLTDMKKKYPDLNLAEELLSVGERGEPVLAIHEQLSNLGYVSETPNEYTANTYDAVIDLKHYMKKLDPEFYNYLQMNLPCGEPVDCSCTQNPCICDTQYPSCKQGSGEHCGCVTYGTYAFIVNYENLGMPNISTNWIEYWNGKVFDSPFSNLTSKHLFSANSPVVEVKPSDSLGLTVKNGWEVKIAVTAYKNGVQQTDNFSGSGGLYLWLTGNDELLVNQHHAKSRGWPVNRDTGQPYRHPIYHLVKTINPVEEMAPNSQPYTTNQTKRPPPDASSNAEEQYVKTNIPIIAESSNSGVTYHLQIIDIRAPFQEWSVYEDALPTGWGVEYGTSALTKFTRDFATSFTGSLEVGIYVGPKISVLGLIDIDFGAFVRYALAYSSQSGKLTNQIMYGYSASAKAGLSGASISWTGKETYPYELDSSNIGGDICTSLLHLIHRIAVWADPDSDGLSEYVDFTYVRPLPVIGEATANLTLGSTSVEAKRLTAEYGSNEITTSIGFSLENDGRKYSCELSDFIDPSNGSMKTGTLTFDIGWEWGLKDSLGDIQAEVENLDGTFSISKMRKLLTGNFDDVIGNSYSPFSSLNPKDWPKPGKLNKYLDSLRRGNSSGSGAQNRNLKMVTGSSPLAMKKNLWTASIGAGIKLKISNVPSNVISSTKSLVDSLFTTSPFDDAISAIAWFESLFSSITTSEEIEALQFEIAFYGEFKGEFKYQWPLFNFYGVIYLYLILKIDASLKAELNFNLDYILQDIAQSYGPGASTAVVYAIWNRPGLIQNLLLAQVPTTATITGSNPTNPIEYQSSGHGFTVGEIVRITGANKMQYNIEYGTILSVDTNTFTVNVDGTGFPANPSWNHGIAVKVGDS